MPQCLIFDLDGTVLDSLEGIRTHLNRARALFDLEPIDKEHCRRLVGRGLRRLVQDSLEGTPKTHLVHQVLSELMKSYRAAPSENTQAFPGIQDLLAELKDEGNVLAIASNKEESLTRDLVDIFFPGSFDLVYGAREGRALKPDPAVIRLISEVHPGLNPLLIGDSGVDLETARNAGIGFVWVGWGLGEISMEELRSYPAARDAKELRLILKGSNHGW